MSAHEFDLVLTLFGYTLLILALSAGIVRARWNVSEPLVALAAGIAGAQLWPDLLQSEVGLTAIEEAARVTLTIALLDVATDLPRHWLRERWKVLLVMLGVVMPLMWLASWSLAWIVPGLAVGTAMLLAAVITPTDPVLAASIATGRLAERHVPSRLRHTIVAESGANDLLAIVFVTFSLWALGPDKSIVGWAVDALGVEILGGIVLGAAAGWVTARVLRYVSDTPYADQASLITVALTLAIALLGTGRLLGSDGILAAFVAGLMLNRSLTGDLAQQKRLFHETVRRFFELPVFMLLGLMLPWHAWAQLDGSSLLFVVLILLLRRIPAVWLCSPVISTVYERKDWLFVGWFGPIGIAALYYAALATQQTGDERIWQLSSLIVTSSVVVHGLSATAFTKWYGAGK